jgi:bacterioferritin (cytochrome b1)
MDALNALLRAEMTAVNQQFIHILALRRLGDLRRADRLYEVDRIDFPNVLRIIDHLVATGRPVELRAEMPAPGLPTAGLLQAELRLEEPLGKILESKPSADDTTGSFFAAAQAPRAAYRDWLTAELQTAEDAGDSGLTYPATDRLFSCLILILERMMVRAFVNWHEGAREAADIAWATSGVAMVQATALVNVLTDLRSAPKLNAKIRKSVRDDRDLIEAYADIADQAALRETEPSLNMIGTRAAAYTRALSTWRPNSPHPALATCAPSFKSFEGTLKKFVWPEAATSPAT